MYVQIHTLRKHELKALQHQVCTELKRRYKKNTAPKYGTLGKAISDEEAQCLFGAVAHPGARVVFQLQYYLGLRISEAAGLRYEDIDLSQRRLWVRSAKDSVPSLLYLHDEVLDILQNHLTRQKKAIASTGLVFPAESSKNKGASLSTNWLRNQLRSAREIAGLTFVYGESEETYNRPSRRLHKVTSHSLRWSFITNVARRTGGDLVVTQRLARHKSVKNTMGYISHNQAALDAAMIEVFAVRNF